MDNNGRTLNLISGPTYTGANLGSAEGSLQASETANYIAYYIIEQGVVDAGGLSNQVIVSASSENSNISDVSDDGDDNDGNTLNDPTVTAITSSPSIEVTKISQLTDNGDGLTGVGDVINYSISVQNTGNVTLNGITITDILHDCLLYTSPSPRD